MALAHGYVPLPESPSHQVCSRPNGATMVSMLNPSADVTVLSEERQIYEGGVVQVLDDEAAQSSEIRARYGATSVATTRYRTNSGRVGFVSIRESERVEMEIRVSRGGEYLEIFFAHRREVSILAFTVPSEENLDPDPEDPEGDTCCARCCARGLRRCALHHVLVTPALRRLKEVGSEIIHGNLLPLLSKQGRACATIWQLVIALVLLAVALPTFVHEARHGSVPHTDTARLALSIVSVILAAIDAAFVNRSCMLCKALLQTKCSFQRLHKRPHGELYSNPEVPIVEKLGKYGDFIRLLFTEILIYPQVICNVLDHATQRSYHGTSLERFAFARFIFSLVSLVLTVYVFRLIVLAITIRTLEKRRRGIGVKTVYMSLDGTEERIERVEKLWEDPDARHRARRGVILEVFFLIHVFGQMLSQGLMLGAIWSKFQCENPETDSTEYISPFTWVMISIAFFVPLTGIFTFFIPIYFWLQEFPIDFMVCMLSALHKRGITQLRVGSQEAVGMLEGLLNKIGNTLDDHEDKFLKKVLYPIKSPLLIMLSFMYDMLLISFAIFALIGLTEMGEYVWCPVFVNITLTDFVNGSHFPLFDAGNAWVWYYIVGLGLVNAANLMVVVIGFFWMMTMVPFVCITSLPNTICMTCACIVLGYYIILQILIWSPE